MKISKIRNVKTPGRGTSKSAGIDFYVPEFNDKFLNDFNNKNKNIDIVFNEIIIKPHERVLIPSGIKADIPNGYMLVAYNKSGISTKKGLDLLASVCDEDYQGEIHISLNNTSNDMVKIIEGEKIIQFILVPIFYDDIEEVDINNLYRTETDRGEGGFGSTGDK